LAQRTRCWYLKKGASGRPARDGNHLYAVIFDLGPCVAPHPSTLGTALLASDVIQTDRRGDLSAADLFGNRSDGTADNTLDDGERIVSITLDAPLPRERAIYRRAISRARAEWPLVEVVVRVVIDNAQFHFVRVTAGGIAPVPMRFERVENALQSCLVDEAAIEQAASLAIEGARPLAQTGYKLQLLEA
jgi:xanthine dehydrogenase YagS FAD-binding subunit